MRNVYFSSLRGSRRFPSIQVIVQSSFQASKRVAGGAKKSVVGFTNAMMFNKAPARLTAAATCKIAKPCERFRGRYKLLMQKNKWQQRDSSQSEWHRTATKRLWMIEKCLLTARDWGTTQRDAEWTQAQMTKKRHKTNTKTQNNQIWISLWLYLGANNWKYEPKTYLFLLLIT